MKKCAKGFCPLLLLFGLMPAGLLPPAFADPILKSQAPCNKGTPDVCQLFTSAGAPSFVVRSIGFRAPSAGSALVLFQGTLYCAHNLNGREAIDIDTPIVDVETAVAARDQPGGARYLFKLQPGNTSATVSTNASRTPGRFFTSSMLALTGLPLNTGHLVYVAYAIPGSLTSWA